MFICLPPLQQTGFNITALRLFFGGAQKSHLDGEWRPPRWSMALTWSPTLRLSRLLRTRRGCLRTRWPPAALTDRHHPAPGLSPTVCRNPSEDREGQGHRQQLLPPAAARAQRPLGQPAQEPKAPCSTGEMGGGGGIALSPWGRVASP